MLTQQFHDILPGSSIAWVHADAEATHARVEQQLRERIAAMLATLAPATPTLTNVASHDRDEIVVVDDARRSTSWCDGDAGRQRTDAVARRGWAARSEPAVPGNGMAPAAPCPSTTTSSSPIAR